MKKLIVFLFVISGLSQFIFSQPSWNIQFSANYYYPVNKIAFIDENTGWASTVGGSFSATS
jgi:TM2 domain-containing membrane protein YozV